MKLILSSDLDNDQFSQYVSLISESKDEPYFYGLGLDINKPRQVIIDDHSTVVGVFEFGTTEYEGKFYHRTNRPYVLNAYRGKGIMSPVLRDWYKTRRPALCWIDDENVASIKVFISLGFEQGLRFQAKTKWGHFYILE